MKRVFTSLSTKSILVAILFAVFSFVNLNAQQVVKCATTYVDSVRHAENPSLQTNDEFEEWLQKEIMHKKNAPKTKVNINGVYYIPIVVHVVHNGEAIGTGTNLSVATIQSQIDVLNEDFRRILGTNGYNTHPDGADTEIEFCLARRRPDGSPFPAGEDGINRINRNTAGFTAPPYGTAYINGTIKPYTTTSGPLAWDASIYMNFWSMDLSGGLLGYAQFPTTVLGGLSCGSQSASTDGVVMLYSSIGKSAVTGNGGVYNEGRTATHEIGHWMGLRHIWGDGGCGVDDFCLDTPESDASNFGCPAGHSSCGSTDMIENYMDYTDDLCMNIFTNDQKMRMRTVMENSPIRASLINSDACTPPAVSDASIINILSPFGDNCPGSIIPTVTLRNRGSSNLTSATIEYTIDGGTPVSFSWTGVITPGNEADVNLPAFTATLGNHTIQAYSLLPNGVTDPDPTYDTSTMLFAISNGIAPNYTQDFDGGVFAPDLRWSVINPNSDCYEWVGGTGVSSTGVTNNAAALMTNFGNGTNQDEYLYTPIFILPCNASAAQMDFDVAYQRRTTASTDELRVEISEDCGATWTNIYSKSGNTLSTVAGTNNAFYTPTASGEWRNEVEDLMAYVTGVSKSIQFRFIGNNNGNGGNIYVDNFNFTATTPGEINITIAGSDILDGGFYNYGTVAQGSTTTATFTIENTGTSNLILTGPISVTGAEFSLNTTFGTTTVAAGGTTTFSVDFNPVSAGSFTGTVSFGTNDCDEGTYNFELNGATNTSPPVAAFTGTPTTLCQGSTVTYTDASSGASTWSWTFPGGTPASATGAGPHTITYSTAGNFDAVLDVTNVFGADNSTQTNYITVIGGTSAALPITEGFVAATFPPANWSLVNGGNVITWERDAANGNAPTAGNSAVIDNFNTNTTGNEDDLVMEPADFTGLVSAQLEFDVAHARYSATYNDQLDVLVSDDCGQTYTVVYSKAGSVLATDPDQTAAYTSPTTWRTETIDLSAYIGSSKVDILFRNISGYSQFVYIDNINLTGVTSSATADFSATPDPACVGQNVTFTDASTGATSWDWDFGAGATPATATGVGPHSVSYSTAGTKSVSLDVNAGADISNQNITITALDDASFSYGGASYCAADSDPTPTVSGIGGGIFTSLPAGLSINASSGEVDLSASTPGSYTVTYSTSGSCPNSTDVSIEIFATPSVPSVTPSGATTFCVGGSVDLTSSQASGNVWSTAETTQTINVTTSGSYSVTYTDGNGCTAVSTPVVVTVNALPTAPTITASGSTSFCTGGSVDLTSSQASGNVWSTTETTQTINVASAGSYSITYTDGNGCSSTSAPTVVTVNANPTAPTITPSGATSFCAGGSVDLVSSEISGNTWSTSETTGLITVNSTGSYSVTYTDGNGCSATSTPVSVTVNAAPTAPVVTASGATTFCVGGSVDLTSSQASGNVWSTTETTQTINVTTSGSYSVTYTDGNGCTAVSTPVVVTVNALPTAPTITASGSTSFCTGGSVDLTSSQASGNVWSTTETTQTINVASAGSYSITYTDGNGCSSISAPTVVTVNANPTAPTITPSGATSFCAGGSVDLVSSEISGNTWSTSETTGLITVNSTGSYSVTYTDGNGCSATSAPISVTVNPAPTAPVVTASGPTTFCVGGSVDLTSSQASGNVWSTSETTQTINVTASGSYSVMYTDGNGCTAVSTPVVVTVNSLPTAPTITASGSTSFCTGGSVDLTSSQASGNVWSTTETTQTINVASAGSYSITYTDGNGCSSTSAPTVVTVNANPTAPTITPSGATSFCAGGSVDLVSSEISGNTWSTSETTGLITVNSTGSYSVTYTDGNGCSATSTPVSVTVNAAPTAPVVTASGATTFCVGGSVDLTSSQASGNVWSTTETTQTINVTTSGSYSVTYTDGNGCTAVSTPVVVTVNALPTAPTITASAATTFCEGGDVTLTSSEPIGNVWSTTSTSNNIVVATSGSYSVTYTDGNGCSATSTSTTITVNPAPVISIGTVVNPTICATATGSIEITGSGTGNVGWTGTDSGTSGVVTLPYTITGLVAGSYNIAFVDASTCASNVINQSLTDPTPPTAPIITASGSTTFCDGSSVTLTSSEISGNTWSTSETTQSINVTTSGTYSVTYTNGSGCSSSSTPIVVSVNSNPAVPTITASGSTTICDGNTVDLTSSEATGIVWSTTETAQTIVASTGGSYTVTYTDGNGCSSTSVATDVIVNPAPSAPVITASGSTTFCDGGSVDLTSSQASGNVWSTSETTQTITVSTSGNYTVVYTDGNGCSASSLFTEVAVLSNPIISSTSVNDPSSCGTSTGSIVVGGSGTGVVSWSGAATGSSGTVVLPYTVSGLAAGSYSITFNQSGCISNTLNESLNDPAAPAAPLIIASGATTFCAGGSVDLTSSQAIGNVWSTSEVTQTINVTTSGTYSVTYTDGSGCSSVSAPISITVNAAPTAPVITASGSTSFCTGGSVDLTSSQLSGNVWSTTEATQTITASAAGSYTVTYTDGNGCSSTSAPTVVTVNANPTAPTITPSGATSFCAGGSVDLVSSEISGNTWSTSEITGLITVNSSGSYSVTYTDGNGCSATSSPISVTVNPAPTAPVVTASGPTTFCIGGSVDLTSSQTSGNVWSTTETTQTVNITSSGSYSVTYTDGNGCTAISTPIVVTVNALPIAPVITASGATTFCTGGSVDLVSSELTGNVWSTTETTNAVNVTSSGSYSVTYTDGNGCSATSAPTVVTVNTSGPAPVISASGPTTFCAGGSVDLTSSEASGNTWSTSETTQTINVTSSGAYTVTYVDAFGCTGTSAPISVTVNAAPTVPVVTASGPTTFCVGGSVDLTSSQVSGNTWSTLETTQSINVTAAGTYTVDYTDANGCTATSAPVVVTVNSNPTAPNIMANGPTTFCAGGSVDLTSSQASGNVWSTTELTQAITASTSGSYSVMYTDGNGCSATSSPVTVIVNANPTAPTISTNGPTTFCAGGSVDLTSSLVGGNNWSTSETAQTISVASSGSYTVTYVDGNGCSATSAPTLVTVNVNPATPVISANSPTTFCEGGAVNLTASQFTGNVWSTTETSQVITVSTSGSYSVMYTDANGCSAISNPTVVIVNTNPAIPTITANGPLTFCADESVDLSSSQTNGNTWSTTESTQTVTINLTGVYTVTYTDGNGCSATSSPVSVTVNPLPVITMSPFEDVCVEESAFTLSAGSPAGGVYSGVGVTGGMFDPNVAGVGVHTITYEYSNAIGCTSSSQMDITVNNCASVNEIENGGFNVYPNPTLNNLNVSSKFGLIDEIKVYDAAGRIVYFINDVSEKSKTIDMSELSVGVYNIEISTENNIYRTRVMKN